MRLWYLADARLPGQAANTVQIMKMCAAFSSCGCDVTLFARLDARQSGDELFKFYCVPQSFRVARAPCLVPGRSHRDPWNLPFTLSALPYLKLRRSHFDAIYTRLPMLAMLAARTQLPVVFEGHRLLPKTSWVSRQIAAAFLKQAQRPHFAGLVGISKVLCDSYVEDGFPPQKILVAHDGVDLNRFEPQPSKAEARLRAGLPADQQIVCYCGHLYAGRGADRLLTCAQAQSDVLFLFVGGTDSEVQRFKQLANSRGISNVVFTGYMPNRDLPNYLFAADALAMPYDSQTGSAMFMSPMKMFEYMAAGRPIVATSFPSIREVLNNGYNAILVEPDNDAALLAGITQALTDPNAALLGHQARRDVQELTWHKRAESILSFIRRHGQPGMNESKSGS